MKYLSLIALIATVSAIKMQEPQNSVFACEYHKSEDGESCVRITNPCNDVEPVPILEKCPARTRSSDRAASPPPAPKVEMEANPSPGTPKPDDSGATPAAN